MGVNESRSRCASRVSGPTISEMHPTVYIRLTTFQVDKIKVSGENSIF